MKAKGITPFGYAGANAPYYMYTALLTSAAKIGGAEVLKNIDNLEDGAWTSDAVKQAAAAWAEVGAKYSNKAFLGLKHTEVQLQQDQYKVGFYPCGSWLENEQAKDTPEGFDYRSCRSRASPAPTSSRSPRSTRRRASSTSSPARARTPRAAWSSCATC